MKTLFKPTLKHVGNSYRDFVGLDMGYKKITNLRWKARDDNFFYLFPINLKKMTENIRFRTKEKPLC